MAHGVLLHRPDSLYLDRPSEQYDFPRQYLGPLQQMVGDWIIYYEPVKAGTKGYFATARVQKIIGHPGIPGRYLAIMEPGTFLRFDQSVPRLRDGRPWESALTAPDGTPARGGRQQLAVRILPAAEYAAIVNAGLPPDLEQLEALRYDPPSTADRFGEAPTGFDRPVIERLTHRPYRDVAFRRRVRQAYDNRCAISGLSLRNGGGRPEVQAAHIRPVAEGGSDDTNNGLALSGTLHWMFDRGLITVDHQTHEILVSHNKVPADVVHRLIQPGQRLSLPRDRAEHPHPANLQWHREHCFGMSDWGAHG